MADRRARGRAAAAPRAPRPTARSAAAPRRVAALGGCSPRPALAWGLAALLLVVGVGAGCSAREALGRATRETITAQVDAARGARDRSRSTDDRGRLVGHATCPAPPAGRVYQVWLDKGGDAPEPTDALFSTSRDGSASVDVPGSLDGVRRVMVTDEPPRRLATRRRGNAAC